VGLDSTFAKGDLVDRFEIRELIGEGGMGAIYRAVDTKIGRTVALKVVRAARLGSSSGEQARQRFLRETLAVSKVDHRNVVRVLDFGFSGDTPYLAMEYLRGRDLGRLLKASTDFLPVSEVVDVMLEVCAAMRACHDAGIIHRDLKPSNIFLCEGDAERVVKILDFGVSKPPIASDLTREGQIVGTPQYLAPEQIDGKAVPQTDQYAIGVMLYACLTRSLPYQEHQSFGLLRAIVVGKFTPPRALRPELPEKLEEIILRAMRAAAEERFESVYALGRELWQFGSSAAREQWRAYYLDDRLRAPAKASTHAMPLIEAMARGLAAQPVHSSVALASTVTAAAISKPPVVEKPTPLVGEKASTPAFVRPPPSQSDPPTPSTAPEQTPEIAGTGRWRKAAVIAAGAAVLTSVGWLALRRQPSVDTPPPPKALAAPAPLPVAPARVAPAPVAPPPIAPAPVAPAPVAPPAALAPAPAAVAPPQQPPRADRQNRRNHHRVPAEQSGNGAAQKTDVPIMP